MPLHENVVGGGDAPDIGEFRRIIAHRCIGERLFERCRFDDDAERGAILRRDLVKVVGGAQAAGARHVLGDHQRRAGKMFSKMARDHAAVEVVAAAGRVADREGDGLAGEERLGRLRLRHGGDEHHERCRDEPSKPRWRTVQSQKPRHGRQPVLSAIDCVRHGSMTNCAPQWHAAIRLTRMAAAVPRRRHPFFKARGTHALRRLRGPYP